MKWPELRLGKHRPRYPLIQGGMGVLISGPRLAAAVAREGGVGTIASVGVACRSSSYFQGRNYFQANQLALRDAIHEARAAAPGGVLAVNAMVALTDYDLHITTACESGIDVLITGAGLPLKLPELTKNFPDVALVPIVSSVRAAQLIVRKWEKSYGRLPDAFVVETPLHAGGHLGATKMEHVTDPAFSLEAVVPELVSTVEKEFQADIPVIAAGGIWTAEDMEAVFALGARGVQVGTRFACTHEGDASDRFKQAYIDAREEDVVVIMSPVGIPGRALRNPFVERYLAGNVESKPCIANCLTFCSYKKERKAFCIAQALIDAYEGRWEEGLFFCGDNVTRCTRMESVPEIFDVFFGANR